MTYCTPENPSTKAIIIVVVGWRASPSVRLSVGMEVVQVLALMCWLCPTQHSLSFNDLEINTLSLSLNQREPPPTHTRAHKHTHGHTHTHTHTARALRHRYRLITWPRPRVYSWYFMATVTSSRTKRAIYKQKYTDFLTKLATFRRRKWQKFAVPRQKHFGVFLQFRR